MTARCHFVETKNTVSFKTNFNEKKWDKMKNETNSQGFKRKINPSCSASTLLARHVLVSSHEMMTIVILTGCFVVTPSSRFRGELQNVTKERCKIFSILQIAWKCDKRTKQQNTSFKLDFKYTKCTVLAATFPEHC